MRECVRACVSACVLAHLLIHLHRIIIFLLPLVNHTDVPLRARVCARVCACACACAHLGSRDEWVLGAKHVDVCVERLVVHLQCLFVCALKTKIFEDHPVDVLWILRRYFVDISKIFLDISKKHLADVS